MKPLPPVALLLFALSIAGCGDDGNPVGPLDGGGPVSPDILDPIPDGVLLGGEGTDAARAVLLNLAPSAAGLGDIVDGFLTTRLTAAIAPAASVADVNVALDAQGARIVSMTRTSPFVTLRIPPVADDAGARAVADALVASGAFLHAAPAHAAEPLAVAAFSGALRADVPSHLQRMRMPAAAHTVELASANNDPITVLIPDEYALTIPHHDIDVQSFVGYGAANPLPGADVYPGNNGFVVAGIVGANPDDVGATGVHPDPVGLLDIDSMALGGLTWFDLFNSLSWRLAASGPRFVLNTGIGYLDPDFVAFPAFDRALHVLAWRIAASGHYHEFLHVVALPEAGPQRSPAAPVDPLLLSSPFLAAACFDDVREMVDLNQVGSADSLALETAWQDMVENFPLATAIANNVIVAGSGGGVRAALPPELPDFVGATVVDVPGPCVSTDPSASPGFLCDGDVAIYSGTAMAAAQVSGLAAYLMNLSSAPPFDIRGVLRHAYEASSTGVVDAYHAVLALDSAPDGDVRRTILDVAGFESSESDGDFDDYDLAALAPVLGESAPPADSPPENYDLNGDGTIGGAGTARFDLNADRSYGTVSVSIEGNNTSFDEDAVTDFEVLCYYAYSALYNGDVDDRRQLLTPLHGGPFLEFVGLPEVIEPGTPTAVTARLGVNDDGVITYVEGVEISFDAFHGDVSTNNAVTDGSGQATVQVTLDPNQNDVTIEAYANVGGENVEAAADIVRPSSVQVVERSVYLMAEVAFGYSTETNPYRWIYDNYSWVEEGSGFFAAVDTSLTETGNATAQGMTAHGTITAHQKSSVDLFGGDQFAGCSIDFWIDGTMTLDNPNLGIEHYQAQSDAECSMDVTFVVWGEGATYNMHGDVTASYYDVDLDGPNGSVFVCNTDDEPCFTISTGDTLAHGWYTLSVDIDDDSFFGEVCTQPNSGCTPGGTDTQESTLSLDLEITPLP